MQLFELPKIVDKRKRVGRGDASGYGTTAGKGNKGERARSGHGHLSAYYEGGQTPIYRRLPKRGFKNQFKAEYDIVNLHVLDKKFNENDEVTLETLISKGLVSGKRLVKILGNGTLSKKLNIKAHAFSKQAISKIEQSNSTFEVL
ncbi:50S ribosomal protein L15 [Desulfurella sp.]|uniref:50S ribosomal protein L15 n=1 Tax=Desulfurella sp. TaxID=1962857 RepID=UPI0025C451DC|nr:50S ribosomal protein L15 [Desulfurella sp.]